MILEISDKYLAFPVARDAAEQKIELYIEGVKIGESDLKLADKADHIFTMDVENYIGRKVEIQSKAPNETLSLIECRSERESADYPYRPQLHYTADEGWINDPNGLVYSDGIYHLYYQWNPYGSSWGNMHWGHAVSRDLINWEQHSMVMEPDEYGTVFSGSAYKDINNAAAFGRDALLYFYTAAGGTNKWSVDRGAGHTQRLAVSFDGGEHLEKKGLLIDHIKGGNRDPKVFYHGDSSSYIMVLYLDENEFAIFRSPDLLHWTESQRLSAEGMWECPDLFCLPIDGDRDNSKWVFWSADGYYMLGSFDGYSFIPETEVLHAYGNGLPYAAQTYSGLADRVISIAWLRTTADNGIYRGMMSIPMELSLTATTKGPRLKISPVRELWEHFDKAEMAADKEGELCYQLEGRAAIIVAEATSDTPVTISIGKSEIDINKSFGPVTIVLDSGIIEYYYDDGLKYFCLEADEDLLTKSIHVKGEAVSAGLYEKRRE